MIDEFLFEMGSSRQREYLQAVEDHGGYRAAARALGVNHDGVRVSIKGLKARAAAQGWAPEAGLVNIAPEPFILGAKSTLRRVEKDGSRTPLLEWDKIRLSDQKFLENIKAAATAFAEGVGPIRAPEGPVAADADIIPWINIGDGHLGMLAHEAETGANFDMKIGERELCTAIALMIDGLPACHRLVINDLGDFTHYENFAAKTEASGHDLDYDSRFPKMITTYSRVMRFIVEKAMTKAQNIDVIVNQGNHSRTNDIWMAELLRVAYGHTGRINVLNNENVFIGYRMGKTFVMTHHSDKCRPAQLAQVMATDFHKDWGESEYRYVDVGHIHHRMATKEHPGVMIESFNSLVGKDRYAHDGGWRSRQSMTMVLRSRTYGEVGRRLLPIDQVRDAIRAQTPTHYRPQPRQAFSV